MKIDEIKAGTEYALKQRHGDPRRVKAMEIVIVPEQIWNEVREECGTRNVRQVVVKHLDRPYDRDRYAPAKGAKQTVEARLIGAPWSEVGPNVAKRQAEKEAADNLQTDLEKRLRAILGRSYNGYVTVSVNGRINLDLFDKSAKKMIELAEAGKAAQSG